ncbi:P-loop containing nucleoside triphosphate hydrolase protein [Collybia nuda]|uniref:P-loop containing nucleoside triphosphate hydrolase protein n=1 Tax=Collybia nuda TaxID=64659 RepID=A0A9P5Y6W3_9AGAR|nr:P-loop containing nucleoside triphosphate hydrolase protein [Collybia nuda]
MPTSSVKPDIRPISLPFLRRSLPPNAPHYTKMVQLSNPSDVRPDDKIIALMGPTGTGKSTFIDIASGQKKKTAGHSLKSETSKVRAIRIPHPDPENKNSYVLVDTPGFNDTNKTDTEVLALIAGWLKDTYKKDVKLAAIVYLHRISDNRMSGSPLQNLRMFSKLCGDGATTHVVLATTMWSKVKAGVGEKREAELKAKFWNAMLQLGSQTDRFEDNAVSAWKIIDQAVSGKQESPLLLQEELVDLNRRLSETEAGKTLYSSLQKLIVEQKEVIRKLRDEANHEQNQQLVKELTMQYEELETSLAATFEQLKEMKIPFGRRLRMLFSFSKPRARPIEI